MTYLYYVHSRAAGTSDQGTKRSIYNFFLACGKDPHGEKSNFASPPSHITFTSKTRPLVAAPSTISFAHQNPLSGFRQDHPNPFSFSILIEKALGRTAPYRQPAVRAEPLALSHPCSTWTKRSSNIYMPLDFCFSMQIWPTKKNFPRYAS